MTTERESLFDAQSAVAVVGSRGFKGDADYYIEIALRGAQTVVSGFARGIDQRAEFMALERGLTAFSYRPRKTGKGDYIVERWLDGERVDAVPGRFPDFPTAAKRRNWWIVRDAKLGTHALWDGMSSGTAHSIAAATRYGRPLHIWMDGDS